MYVAAITEFLNLLVRWAHVISGIMWIGSSLFFNWLDSHLDKVADASRKGVEGELYMVHSGGFYQVEKKHIAPEALPKRLHWFKWEAGFTLLTGWVLLDIVFFQGGAVTLVDPNVSRLGPTMASVLCVAGLVGSWFVYDVLWRSPLVKNVYVGAAITYALVVAVLYHLTHAISGRAAYLMTGAMMGTWMATNVWVHIIPAQKALVASVVARTPPDAKYAKHAKTRSRHNNYMTYPVVLIMLSNHFPGAYGHSYNWLILAVLIACGASVRHLQNVTRELSPAILIGALAVVFAVGHSALTSPALQSGPSTTGSAATPLVASRPSSHGGPLVVDNEASVGHAKGVVLLDGNPPPANAINVGSCVAESTIKNEAILSVGGKLQNAFVWVRSGLNGYPVKKAPMEPIVLDQKGCLYRPHVVGAQVGQRVVILNSDPVFHNVRTVADQNTTFNEMMPTKDMRLEKIFDKPEVMVRAKCDVHPWMSAFVGVVPHPFFAVSSESGEFSLENLPAGEYEIEAWHEALGRQTQKVRIEAQKSITLSFTFRVE